MNSNRLKDIIKTKNLGISFEEYRIRYATERFLSRLQESNYKDNFIIKGGFLLGAIFKVEQRTTRDLDTLIKEISVDKMNITRVLENIVSIDLDDGVQFKLISLMASQQQRKYEGFRAKFKMNFLEEKSIVQFDLDLGVGDTITPKAEVIDIPLLFNEKKGERKSITLQAYPIETILAEKTEIILDLGTKNSRMKDFYDIHLILNYQYKPSVTKCYEAFENTWLFRHKELPIDKERFEDWLFIVDEIIVNEKMNDIYWKNYIKDREYAKHLKFKTILRQFKEYLEKLHKVYLE
ncbi:MULTISPECIES: nucleotidyl transferase AbiEii/AbiGii toxin family protein [Enterococcus]|uniref:nucleotidyl transferase AbiEii/AbiGii toxin family protein n=1 Tax=Enterococcus TaxID=1350 RepID=UPI00031802D7|nr:nucleotidyl transferase AbiEii/AbiGii toxin family protein [Enterococcus mundtii]OBS62271.1 hypothetical protein AX758_11255 [Enterococcus mundtii]